MNILSFGKGKAVNEPPRDPPRLPPLEHPHENQRYTPPALRRDPEIEAMMISANTLLELRERVTALQVEGATLLAERETWRARAEANEHLLNETGRELDRFKSFSTELVTQINTVSVILLDVITKAQKMASDFHNLPARERDPLPEPIINEGHLLETTDDK